MLQTPLTWIVWIAVQCMNTVCFVLHTVACVRTQYVLYVIYHMLYTHMSIYIYVACDIFTYVRTYAYAYVRTYVCTIIIMWGVSVCDTIDKVVINHFQFHIQTYIRIYSMCVKLIHNSIRYVLIATYVYLHSTFALSQYLRMYMHTEYYHT